MRRHATPALLAAAWSLAAAPVPVGAMQTPPPEDAPERLGDQERPGAREPGAPPSLDDLLGLDETDADTSAQEAARRQAREELDRELNETAIRDAFGVALEKMGLTADLLENKLDGGLGTQRLQEEIIRKLDELIDAARKQQMMASSASSGSSSSGSPATPQPRPGDPAGQPRAQAGDSQPGGPPARQDGDINTVLEETRSEWGHLPPRVRDELLEAMSSPVSSLYRRLTEEYYRRLADEG